MELGLKEKVVLITGASAGIGKAAALAFASEGAILVLCARGEERLHETARECEEHGAKVITQVADVSKSEDIESLFKRIVADFGNLDVLINNAGEGQRSLEILPPDDVWQEHFDQYLMSVIRVTRLAIPLLKNNGGGRVINISSGNWKEPGEGSATRSTMKAAVTTLTKTLANKLAREGIIFNTVSPGLIETERLSAPGSIGDSMARKAGKSIQEALGDYVEKNIPLGRLATTEDVANVIVFLASNKAAGVLGSDYGVDAGGHKSL